MFISFYRYDCLCKPEPRKLLAIKVRTSIVFIGHHPPFETRGHLIIGKSHLAVIHADAYLYIVPSRS